MLYCIIHQYGEMRDDWRPFNKKGQIFIYTNKKLAQGVLKIIQEEYPKKQLWIAKVSLEINHV